MPVRAVLHAVSRAVSPVPKPKFPDSDDSNSGYRDQPRYQPPEPRSPPSIYSHESWTAQSLNGLQNGQHEEDYAPPLPPRRAEHAAMPRIEVSAQDYEPPPGPPPGYFNSSAPPSSSPSPVSSPLTPELKASRDPFSTPVISNLDAKGNIDYDSDNMKLGELIPALVAPHLPPRPRSSNAATARILPKPIAIPSVNTELGSPYMRAYPPCLGDHGIPQDTFLRFLDRLNRVSAASPPVVMLGLGASVVSLIPEPTTAIVATAVDLTCQVSVYAISKGRTEILLAEANKEIFGPRGLKVQIAKLEAVARIAGIPVLDDEGKLLSSNPEKQKKKKDADGNAAPPTRLLAPLEDIHEVHTLSAQHRRLRALAPWTMPLEFDGLPDVYAVAQEGDLDETQTQSQEKDGGGGGGGGGGISAMGKLHQYVSDYQRKTGEEKLIKGRRKALDRLTESRQKAQERYEKKLRELEKDESRLQEKIVKKTDSNSSTKSEEKELEKIVTKKTVTLPEELDKEMEKIQRKYEKDDQEEKGIRRIHYLIVTDKDDIERQTENGGFDAEKVGELAKQGNLDVPQKTF